MPFLLLLLLALLSLQGRWPAPPEWLGVYGGVTATAGVILTLWLAGSWLARRQVQALSDNPDQRSSLLPRFHRQRSKLFLFLTAAYLAALFFLGWGWSMHKVWSEHARSWPGLELVLLAPFLTGLLLLWACFYGVDRTAYDLAHSEETHPFPSRKVYVALQARHNLLLVIPPLFLVLVQETLFFLAPGIRQHPLASVVFAIGLVALALVSMPYLLKSFLGLKPLPAGDVRQRLVATAQRLNFTFKDILLWQTRATVANAMVTGLFRWNRYVVVTDRLMQELTEDEIDAVFGHEVGHAKHHHLWFYILFILTSLAALNGVWNLGQLAWRHLQLQPSETLEILAALPFLGVITGYLFVVFGYISRRCERQADIYGAKATSCQTFIDALERVAIINGISRDRPGWLSSWQHATIAQRVDFLRQMTVDPELEPRFQRRLGFVKWGLSGCLVAAAIFLAIANSYLTPNGLWEMLRLFG